VSGRFDTAPANLPTIAHSFLSTNSLPDVPFAESMVLSNEFKRSNEWILPTAKTLRATSL